MNFKPIIILRSLSTLTNSLALKTYHHPNTWAKQQVILAENKHKPGIYRWVNQLNGKSYIGSSASLANRLRAYFSVPSLKGSDLVINQALLKHGLANFSLEILAYCDLKDLAAKEQYFISKYQSEYNLNLKA